MLKMEKHFLNAVATSKVNGFYNANNKCLMRMNGNIYNYNTISFQLYQDYDNTVLCQTKWLKYVLLQNAQCDTHH